MEETPLRQLRRLVSKGSVGVAVLALLAVLLAACGAAPSVDPAPKVGSYQGGPRLALDNKSLDFGNVSYNQEVKATFNLKNVGDQPLRIEKVDVKTLEGC